MLFLRFWTIIGYVLYVLEKFMKKIIIQFWQWILRHRKKLIYGALAFFIIQVCFFDIWGIWMQSYVFAGEWWDTSSQYLVQKVGKWLEEFKFFNIVINVLIYPILIIAWKLVDNSLVYWEIFWFDAILRKLWVMIRNLSNIWLWLLFIYKICEYLIKWQKTSDIKKLLISVLIAWVWIQASRFIMSVLIDASTILTYWVWWLPISILEEEEKEDNFKNPYVLKTIVTYDAKEPDEIRLYMSTWQKYISECETFNYSEGDAEETLILGPRYIYYEELVEQYFETEKLKCNHDGQVYFFSSLYDKLTRDSCSDWSGCRAKQATYKESLQNAKAELRGSTGDANTDVKGKVTENITKWVILQIWNAHASWWINWNIFKGISYGTGNRRGLDVDNEWNGSDWNLKRLDDVLDWTYAWVFSELYASLMHIGKDMGITRAKAENNTYAELLNEALSLLYAITIAIPLIAMVIVLIGRIWVLWMAIPLSPAIALIKSFDLESKIVKKEDDFLAKFKVENLLPVIFFPVVICFAISLSAVLIKIIIHLNWEVIETKELPILSWVIKLNIASFGVAIGKTICSIMCVAVTWFLAWAAIKTTILWKSKVVTWLADITRNAIWSLPIIPIPTKEGTRAVGIDAAFWLNGHEWIAKTLSNKVKTTFSDQDNDAIKQLLGEVDPWEQEARQLKAYVEKVGSNPSTERRKSGVTIGNWVSTKTFNFNSMTAEQTKQVVEEMNKLWDEVKDKLWKNGEEWITIEGKDTKYTYNTTTHNFEAVQNDQQSGSWDQQSGSWDQQSESWDQQSGSWNQQSGSWNGSWGQ